MSDANPISEAGAGAEALLGLAAQAGQAVRLPSLPSIAKPPPPPPPPPPTQTSYLPSPPSLSLPTQHTQAQTLPSHPASLQHPPAVSQSLPQSHPLQQSHTLPQSHPLPQPHPLPQSHPLPQTHQPPLQPQSQQTLQHPAQTPLQPQTATPLQPSAPPLHPPPPLSRDRLPTLSEWSDPAYRHAIPPSMLAPLPDRWQATPPVPPAQYPYPNPCQAYPYPPHYYYYQQQSMSYPVPHLPSVAPVPPPLALPTPPVVPTLRVPTHADPIRDAAASNDACAYTRVPQPHTAASRDPLLQRLTSEAAAATAKVSAPEEKSSRAPLADLMNPTDTVPCPANVITQPRMEQPIVKPESIETIVTPVTVPSVPSAEPKLTDIVKEQPRASKLDLAVIAGVATDDASVYLPPKAEQVTGDDKHVKENGENGKEKNESQAIDVESLEAQEQKNTADEKARGKADEKADKKVDKKADEKVEEEKEKAMKSGKDENDAVAKSNEKQRAPAKETAEVPEQTDEVMRDRTNDTASEAEANEGDEEEEEEMDDDDGENGDEETRCPCGSTANSGTMIACDQCNTWQHWRCMGFRRSSEVPDKYFCHICKPHEIRPNCIAHPKYKERSNRDRSSLDRREHEAQLAVVKPIELRRLFMSDMRHRKTLLRSKGEVFLRYAGHLKNPYGKYRSSVIDGLMILFDMQRQDVVERLDAATRRLKPDRHEEADRKRGGTSISNDGHGSEASGTRTSGLNRSQAQKRARPQSLSMDALETTSGGRGESNDNLGDFDLGADASHGRNMSREERKLQQTMKLFARMEEREREKKKPRTGDVNSSPKAAPPSRSRTPKPSSLRTASPKSSTAVAETEEISRTDMNETEQEAESADIQEQKQAPTDESRNVETTSPTQKQIESTCPPKIVQPMPQPKSSLTQRSETEAVKKEREQRRERVERITPKRKESASPDNVNGNVSGRRRNILVRERSQETKRRRVGQSRESERRVSREPPRRNSNLEFSLFLPGPSVLGSRRIKNSRLSAEDRESREKEDFEAKSTASLALRESKKERMLGGARDEAMAEFLNGGRSSSPMKKRYRLGDELRDADSDNDHGNEQNGTEETSDELSKNGKKAETVSVSMVVVSEKGSLPDRGQILESTRLILPGSNRKPEDASEGKVKEVCLKKRPAMLKISDEPAGPSNRETSPKQNTFQTHANSNATAKVSPSSPLLKKVPSSPSRPVLSPLLRSCPAPAIRSPSFRSVPADDSKQLARSSSPLPSFKSQKLSPPTQKRRSCTPETDKVQSNNVANLSVQLFSSAAPARKHEENVNRSPNSSATGNPDGEKTRVSEQRAMTSSGPKVVPETKTTAAPLGPPPLKSIRSVPPPSFKMIEQAQVKQQTMEKEETHDRVVIDSEQNAPDKVASGGDTFGGSFDDIIKQRLQGFLRPGASPSPPPRGLAAKLGISSPKPSPRSSGPNVNAVPAGVSVRGSTAKLSAALPLNSKPSPLPLSSKPNPLPLSSKPNLDSLRNSNGLSPRVSGNGHLYQKNYGPGHRNKFSAPDRSWNSVPSFSLLKRQHSFGRGSRGSSLMGGKPGSFSGMDRGRQGHGRDGIPYGREDAIEKMRPGYRRDGHFPNGRDDDKAPTGNQHMWNRSYGPRHGRGGGHGHHGDGSGRGNRRGHYGS